MKQTSFFDVLEGDGFEAFSDWAIDQWEDRYGHRPPWGPSDHKHLKAGFIQLGDFARDYWHGYLHDRSDYAQGHSPGKWASDLGRWPPVETDKSEMRRVRRGLR
jgi:hypothetical protein